MATGTNASGFQSSLSFTTGWLAGDWIYVYAFGRQNMTFNTPTGVSTGWTLLHQNSVLGGAGVISVWRVRASSNGSGSIQVTRGTTNAAWLIAGFVMRGLDPTTPEDGDIVSVRPGTGRDGATAFLDMSNYSPTRFGCFMLLIGVADNGRIEWGQPALRVVSNSAQNELGDLRLAPAPSYEMKLAETTATTNWMGLGIPLKAAS